MFDYTSEIVYQINLLKEEQEKVKGKDTVAFLEISRKIAELLLLYADYTK